MIHSVLQDPPSPTTKRGYSFFCSLLKRNLTNRDDIGYPQNLAHHSCRQRGVQMDEGDCIAAHPVPAQVHGGNIDFLASQGRSDIPDHSRLVVIMDEQDMSLRNGFDEKVVELHDP